MANVSSSNGIEKYPKLRFQGFTIPWTEIEIGKAFQVTRGYVLPATVVRQDASEEYIYPVYSSQTKDNGLMGYYNDYLYENAITWTTDGANAGTVHYRPGKFYCTNVCGVLLSDEGNANRCVAEILGSISKKYVSYVGNPKLMNNVMSEIKIYVPTIAEQKKIDEFISVIDHRIEKQRELIEHLKKYKRGVSKRFFDEVHSDQTCAIKRFSEVFELLQNNTFSRECLTDENTDVLNVHYGDILVKYGSVVDPDIDTVPFIKSETDISKFSNSSYLQDGDIIFADTAEDYTVGKMCEIVNVSNRRVLSGLHTMPFRPTIAFAPMYLGYYLNSAVFRTQILPMIQGAKVSSISKSEMKKTVMYIPSIKLQKEIVNVLNALDKRIKITELVLEGLKDMKQGLLQQLFI